MTGERQELSAEELEGQNVTELPVREAMTLITTGSEFLGVVADDTPIPPDEALPDSEPVLPGYPVSDSEPTPPDEALPDPEPTPPDEALPDGDVK